LFDESLADIPCFYLKTKIIVAETKLNRAAPKAAVAVGVALILFGLVANQWVLTFLFSDDRSIEFSGKLIIIWAIDLASIVAGVWFVTQRKSTRISGFSINILLFSGSSVILVIILELLFPLVQTSIPVEVRNYVPWPYTVLSQSTKRSRIPRDYIAIFGDSYAEGGGDWYLDVGKSSANILADGLHRDLVSFGVGGASSVTGIAVTPRVSLRRLRYRVDIEDPRSILIYFYEGNDLEGNLRDLSMRQPNYFEFMETTVLDEDEYHDYLDEVVLRTDGLVPPEVVKVFEIASSRLIASGFLWNIAQRLFGTWEEPGLILQKIKSIRKSSVREDQSINLQKRGHHELLNLVEVDVGLVNLRGYLQGPALQLTENEKRLGLALLEYSITSAKEHFKNSTISLVYIPSPLSCYHLRSNVTTQRYYRDRVSEFTPDKVRSNSNWIASEVAKIARQHGIRFIDPRDELRSSGKLLHGPKDFKHFNRTGYEILAGTIIKALSGQNTGE